MKNLTNIFIGLVLLIIGGLNSIKAQTIVDPGYTVSLSVSDNNYGGNRAIGWAGGQTFTYTKTGGGNFPGCTYWGIEIPTGTNCDAHINMNNTTGPGTTCAYGTGSDLPVYSSGISGTTLTITGSTQVYVNNGSSWSTQTVSTRAIITVTGAPGTWINNGSTYMIQVANDPSFAVNVKYEGYGPSGSYYNGTNYGGSWTPVITLYDALRTNSGRSICTSWDPEFFCLFRSCSQCNYRRNYTYLP